MFLKIFDIRTGVRTKPALMSSSTCVSSARVFVMLVDFSAKPEIIMNLFCKATKLVVESHLYDEWFARHYARHSQTRVGVRTRVHARCRAVAVNDPLSISFAICRETSSL